jgi:hypothetical protein
VRTMAFVHPAAPNLRRKSEAENSKNESNNALWHSWFCPKCEAKTKRDSLLYALHS